MGGLVTTQWRLHSPSGYEYLIELKHSHTNGMRQLSINGRVVFKLEKNTYDTGGEDTFEIEGKKGFVITRTHHHTFHYQCVYDGKELRKEAKAHAKSESTSSSSSNTSNSSTSDTQTLSGISDIVGVDFKDSVGTSTTAPLAGASVLGAELTQTNNSSVFPSSSIK